MVETEVLATVSKKKHSIRKARREFLKRRREMQLTMEDYKEGDEHKARRELAYKARERDDAVTTALRVAFMKAIDEGAKTGRESCSGMGGDAVGGGGCWRGE